VKALRPRLAWLCQGRISRRCEMVAIFVILTIVAFILVDAAVQRRQVRR
jgi:hypothetical protein